LRPGFVPLSIGSGWWRLVRHSGIPLRLFGIKAAIRARPGVSDIKATPTLAHVDRLPANPQMRTAFGVIAGLTA